MSAGLQHLARLRQGYGLKVMITHELEHHSETVIQDHLDAPPQGSARELMTENPLFDASLWPDVDPATVLLVSCFDDRPDPVVSLAARVVSFGPRPMAEIADGTFFYGRPAPACQLQVTEPVEFAELADQPVLVIGGLRKRRHYDHDVIAPLWRYTVDRMLALPWVAVFGTQKRYNVERDGWWPEGFLTVSYCLRWSGPPKPHDLAVTTMSRQRAAYIADVVDYDRPAA
jgi:hypothetical protein